METSKILKTFSKHLLIPYAMILGLNIILIILSLLINPFYDAPYLCISINTIFSFLIGYIIYGSYGRSFALIQNNKKNFIMSSFIFIIANSILLTLLVFLILLIGFNKTISILSIIIIFLLFIGSTYLASLYGLLFKNKKIRKLFFMIIALGLCIVFIGFLDTQINGFLDYLLTNSNNTKDFVKYLLLLGIPSITLCVICNFLYSYLNIAKVYSHE